MTFSVHAGSDKKEEFNLIPRGMRLWVDLNLREIKISENGNRYLDIECTVVQGQPYAGKKIWTIVMDPFDGNLNSSIAAASGEYRTKLENTREMGISALARILEGSGRATPDRPDTYGFNVKDHAGRPTFAEIHGLRVPILVGVKEDKTGQYPPKNSVTSWLSPNKNRRDYKHYEAAIAGQFYPDNAAGPVAPPAPQQQGFGFGAQQAAPAPSPAPAGPAVTTPPGGWSPQPATAPASPFGANAAPSGWMAQGNPPAQHNQAPAQNGNHQGGQAWQPGRSG